MSFKVMYLNTAREELRTILNYLAQFYPSTPKKFESAMDKFKLNIEDNPYMYPVYENRPYFRKAVVLKYIVLYTVDDEKKLVEIHRVIPGNWNIPSQLGEY